MSEDRAMPTIVTKTVGGPWGSRYKVSAETLAVNVAQFSQYEEITTVEGVAALAAYPDDGSIYGFWGKQLRKLNADQQTLVAVLASGLEDPGELFDGQI